MSFLIIIGVYLFYHVEKTGQDWVNERENDRCCELFALKDGYQFVDHEEQKKYYYDKEGRVSRIADRLEMNPALHMTGISSCSFCL